MLVRELSVLVEEVEAEAEEAIIVLVLQRAVKERHLTLVWDLEVLSHPLQLL